MNHLFEGMDLTKLDLNTRKELEQDGWRIPNEEEKKAYAVYYLRKCIPQKKFQIIRVLSFMIFFVSICELLFELVCRNDPSFNPIPMELGIVASILLLFLNERICDMTKKSALAELKNKLFVIDAIAYNYNDNKIQVMLNREKINFQKYVYKQALNPSDYAYDESGERVGFHILLFVVLDHQTCVRKDILGSQEYQYYYSCSNHMGRKQAWIESIN